MSEEWVEEFQKFQGGGYEEGKLCDLCEIDFYIKFVFEPHETAPSTGSGS